ncbi:SecY-interacting protein [Amphritea balenae]|uniref:Protein Syd n=1 Tax=Amphritea balenae TaxID=452629 RepID=A0A3P1SWU1_9GAMM|nr:SecY-interacting protein [Amphritea balenae]RRD00996.1 SecY-interacting protein [Amphritea balenae]GGK60885.1 protein Syd [Amphritea balenae]
MSQTLTQQLKQFIALSVQLQQQNSGRLPLTHYDNEWPSPCYQGEPDQQQRIEWQPAHQSDQNNPCQAMFDRLETAIGYSIHPDIREWYSCIWSDPIPASCQDGDLSLLFLWNEADCERLRGNLIGHLLTKQKRKQPATLFFACTEPDGDQFLSVDNQTGEIWLEQPGKKPIRKLADNLSEFLSQLKPELIPDQE